ncbi:dual specificity protein phosphatase family protein [Vibrio quintilis]|uniref:Dual specificity phosphatase, catalytic domain n=1 Tax=Vibrio quintilis TaxID=1117707 RepID=A0A1M7YYR3_9VIBR|nr:dual specificity protein phosphatase family protein [Vibrio quintilis]SHO57725.1 Dual specificity phosphatase, catalytic domain [Vibrio quintilis]
MSEVKRYPRPLISLIQADIPNWHVDLYIGESAGVSDPDLLREFGIKVVLNCAVNLDINLVSQPEANRPAGVFDYGSGPVRYYKVGLIDGPGNTPEMMFAGYCMLKSALDQTIPDKPSYKNRDKGNVLVNCRGGRSRSVTVVAIFLHLEFPQLYPTLDAAIHHIRQTRELHPDEWFETPKPQMIELAQATVTMVKTLRQSALLPSPESSSSGFVDLKSEQASFTE